MSSANTVTVTAMQRSFRKTQGLLGCLIPPYHFTWWATLNADRKGKRQLFDSEFDGKNEDCSNAKASSPYIDYEKK
jgi:hypothetical protein